MATFCAALWSTFTLPLTPALLQLYDLPEDEISGAQLLHMHVDPKRLIKAGLLELCGRQNIVLIDDDEDFGDIEVGAFKATGVAGMKDRSEQDIGSMPLHNLRRYAIKRDWLDELLLPVIQALIGNASVDMLDLDLVSFGHWRHSDAELPVYFARRLGQPKTLQRLDMILRSRQDGGIGIVLSSGRSGYTHLGPNVVVPLEDFLQSGQLTEDAKTKIFERYQAGRWLALGGSEVALIKFASLSAMLHIPGKVPLAVSGFKQMLIIERLVAAYKVGSAEVPTGALIEGTKVKSPADAWPSQSRDGVSGVYFENSRQGFWRLKTDQTVTGN
ncbi:hypothetical protein [Cypionkella psychrotolerans]|uniref:hypothetical protein n=1 Tax=Cypionkella psychrotolerans TaxID=1678131 RepID=UPI000A813240|nr:hypothetical protein [Cypionkella psychrotolerans]